ncbi:MAG: hypothetical protein EA424_19190 [Planctomycetaceae bacterium]|nr:MAG: hypothetical protein EA424_19190 [Planctomycetaceae bacterium]
MFTAVLLLATASWLLVRRVSGALQSPLPGFFLPILGGLFGALIAAAGWIEGGFGRTRVDSGIESVRRWPYCRLLLSFAILVAGVAVSLPEASVTALFGFWTLALVGAIAGWCRLPTWSKADIRGRDEANKTVTERLGAPTLDPTGFATGCVGIDCESDEEGEEEGEEDVESEQLLPVHVSQRVVRARDERDAEVVFGTVRCSFAPGQRQQSIHLAFCPPLRKLAQLATDQVAGPAVQIKTVTAETFGVGLEAKLASPSKEPTEVQIQFFAFEKSPDDRDE